MVCVAPCVSIETLIIITCNNCIQVVKLHTKLGKPIPSTEPVVVGGGIKTTTGTTASTTTPVKTVTTTAAKPAIPGAAKKTVTAAPKINFVAGKTLM
jgi:zinc finger RNA-binding protein